MKARVTPARCAQPPAWSLEWLIHHQAHVAHLGAVAGYARPTDNPEYWHFWPESGLGKRPLRMGLPLLRFEQETLELTLQMEVKTKARPRTGRTRTGRTVVYGQEDYMAWKREAALRLRAQWRPRPALQRVESLEVVLVAPVGNFDPDNALGAVLDAMTEAGVIADDKITTLPRTSTAWVRFAPPAITIKMVVHRIPEKK